MAIWDEVLMRSFFTSVLGLAGKPKAQGRSRSKPTSGLNGLGFDRLETRSMLAVTPAVIEAPIETTAEQSVTASWVLSAPASAPRDIIATPGDGSVNLMWRQSADMGSWGPIRNYRVFYREAGSETWTRLVRPPSTALTATVSGLTNGKHYMFRVQAISGIAGDYRDTPGSVPVRGSLVRAETPYNLMAQASDGKATLSWSPPNSVSGQIQDYVIRYTTDGQSWKKVGRPVSTDLTATVDGLANGTRYAFRVRALTSAGPTHASAASIYVRPATAPNAPINIIATVVGEGAVSLTWDAPNDGGRQIIQYDISWDSTRNVGLLVEWTQAIDLDGFFDTRETVRVEPGPRASVTLHNLQPDTTYKFYIRARNLLGMGNYSTSNEVNTENMITSASSPLK